MRSDEAGGAVDPVVAEVAAMLARLGALAVEPAPGTDADRIDRIAAFEQLRGALAAAQQAEMVAFARSQVEQHIADDRFDPAAVGRGIGDQVGLACRVSPFHGSRRLGIARALHFDLPGVRDLLAAGRISEEIAATVVSETRHLDAERRRLVDEQICAAEIDRLSPGRAAAVVGRLAYEADRAAYVARGRTARKDRRVGLRPAPDTMSVLSGFLPVEQGVACLAALRKHTDAVVAAGDTRTRGQIMADTLVERVTGQARAADVNVEVGIVIPVEALVDPHSDLAPDPGRDRRRCRPGRGAAAEIAGYGPIPAAIACDILAGTEGRRWWRRLFTAPDRRSGRRRPPPPVFRRGARTPDPGPRRRPLPRSVLRRPDPPPRPHLPAPGRWPHQPGQRPRGVRPRQLRARDARLAGRARARRPRPTSAHRAHHHAHRAHLRQSGGPGC